MVGTAAAVGFGPTGWLGGIVVAPPARGSGLGRTLTEAAITALGPRDTLLLLASDLGRPIYDRLGFVSEGRYRVFMAAARSVPLGSPPDPVRETAHLRAITPDDRDAVLAPA